MRFLKKLEKEWENVNDFVKEATNKFRFGEVQLENGKMMRQLFDVNVDEFVSG